MQKSGPVSFGTAPLVATATRSAALGIAALMLSLCGDLTWLYAASDDAYSSLFESGSTSEINRRNAMRTLPLDKLAPADRAKVESVLANTSIFRRMPLKVVECDPDLYLFLLRHPDVVVNIWELMKVSQLQVRQTGPQRFQVTEALGTAGSMEVLYSSNDMQVVYGEGTYRGPLFPRPVKGRVALLLKTGYVRQTDGHYYVTSRLDAFVNIEPAGAELLTKTIQPILGKTADSNFVQTVNFVASLSRTVETNNYGVQHLASRLQHVSPEVRRQFAALAANIGQRMAALERPSHSEIAASAKEAADH